MDAALKFRNSLILVAALVGVAACGGDMDDLDQYVNEVKSGTECGIGVKNYDNVQVADQIECFERIEVARTLD